MVNLKLTGVVVHTCNYSPWEAGAGGSPKVQYSVLQVPAQLELLSVSTSWNNKEKEGRREVSLLNYTGILVYLFIEIVLFLQKNRVSALFIKRLNRF